MDKYEAAHKVIDLLTAANTGQNIRHQINQIPDLQLRDIMEGMTGQLYAASLLLATTKTISLKTFLDHMSANVSIAESFANTTPEAP